MSPALLVGGLLIAAWAPWATRTTRASRAGPLVHVALVAHVGLLESRGPLVHVRGILVPLVASPLLLASIGRAALAKGTVLGPRPSHPSVGATHPTAPHHATTGTTATAGLGTFALNLQRRGLWLRLALKATSKTAVMKGEQSKHTSMTSYWMINTAV